MPPLSSMQDREGLEALPDTLAERGITFFITMVASGVMCE
jgi:hypothetical protein